MPFHVSQERKEIVTVTQIVDENDRVYSHASSSVQLDFGKVVLVHHVNMCTMTMLTC